MLGLSATSLLQNGPQGLLVNNSRHGQPQAGGRCGTQHPSGCTWLVCGTQGATQLALDLPSCLSFPCWNMRGIAVQVLCSKKKKKPQVFQRRELGNNSALKLGFLPEGKRNQPLGSPPAQHGCSSRASLGLSHPHHMRAVQTYA